MRGVSELQVVADASVISLCVGAVPSIEKSVISLRVPRCIDGLGKLSNAPETGLSSERSSRFSG